MDGGSRPADAPVEWRTGAAPGRSLLPAADADPAGGVNPGSGHRDRPRTAPVGSRPQVVVPDQRHPAAALAGRTTKLSRTMSSGGCPSAPGPRLRATTAVCIIANETGPRPHRLHSPVSSPAPVGFPTWPSGPAWTTATGPLLKSMGLGPGHGWPGRGADGVPAARVLPARAAALVGASAALWLTWSGDRRGRRPGHRRRRPSIRSTITNADVRRPVRRGPTHVAGRHRPSARRPDPSRRLRCAAAARIRDARGDRSDRHRSTRPAVPSAIARTACADVGRRFWPVDREGMPRLHSRAIDRPPLTLPCCRGRPVVTPPATPVGSICRPARLRFSSTWASSHRLDAFRSPGTIRSPYLGCIAANRGFKSNLAISAPENSLARPPRLPQKCWVAHLDGSSRGRWQWQPAHLSIRTVMSSSIPSFSTGLRHADRLALWSAGGW